MMVAFRVALISFSSIALIGAAPEVPATEASNIYVVPLSGMAEADPVPTAGDPDGSGTVKLTVDLNRNRVCYDFQLSGLATPLMAHIHRGPVAHNGPSVVTLFTGTGGDLDDCIMWTEKRLAEIVANPSNFYVNLYTTEFPDGALRGQLHA